MSGVPFVKDDDPVYGAPTRVSPLIRRVLARNPGPFTYTGSGTYLVGPDAGPLAVIDPGPNLDAHLDALVAAVDAAPVSHVLVTHTHKDHCGLARRFADAVGAPVLAFGPHPATRAEDDAPPLEEGGDRDFAPDATLADGDIVKGAGWTLEAVHTPGHISNHLCFVLREERALFTGDHLMGWATTVVLPPDGSMADYFDSLEKLLARDDAVYYPTHGAPIAKPHAFARAVRAHRRMRDGQILSELDRGPRTIADIVAKVYADVDPRLHGAAALNVFAHLIRLTATGEAVADPAPEMRARYARG
ncbi:MAG: MBL fold metallo-hydrolase [Parvularculaceae bacterium]